MEEYETEVEALKRELKEELNIEIKPIEKISESSNDIQDEQAHWWKCEIEAGEIKINKDEIREAKYFTLDQMRSMNIWPAKKNFFNL